MAERETVVEKINTWANKNQTEASAVQVELLAHTTRLPSLFCGKARRKLHVNVSFQ